MSPGSRFTCGPPLDLGPSLFMKGARVRSSPAVPLTAATSSDPLSTIATSSASSPVFGCSRARPSRTRLAPGAARETARERLARVRRAESLEARIEAVGALTECRRERGVPLLTAADAPAVLADPEKAVGGEEAVDGDVRDRERVRVRGPRRLERAERRLVRR